MKIFSVVVSAIALVTLWGDTSPYKLEAKMDVTEKRLVLVQQIHKEAQDSEDNWIRATIKVQKSIVSIIRSHKQKDARTLICPEGAFDSNYFDRNLEPVKRDLHDLVAAATALSKQGESDHIPDMLQDWHDWLLTRFSPGYAQAMFLLGSSELEPLANQAVKVRLSKINPYGSDARYYIGAVEHLVLSGDITRKDVFACEDGRAFQGGIELLTQPAEQDERRVVQQLEDLSREREQSIVEKTARFLHSQDGVNTIIVVLGALHDLSDDVAKYNSWSPNKLSLVVITPDHLEEGMALVGK